MNSPEGNFNIITAIQDQGYQGPQSSFYKLKAFSNLVGLDVIYLNSINAFYYASSVFNNNNAKILILSQNLININPSLNFSNIESNAVRCPDIETAKKMEKHILEIKKQGDTIGGTITCVIQNVPIGLGEPVFDKLHAELGKAMLSINAVKGFEYGSGFCGSQMKGSEHNDLYNSDGTTKTNLSGGIQGGISNGMDIYFRVAFKPVATLIQKQEVLSSENLIIEQQGKGRHDPCVVPRAVPIVEAMAAIVLADFYLLNKSYQK